MLLKEPVGYWLTGFFMLGVASRVLFPWLREPQPPKREPQPPKRESQLPKRETQLPSGA